MRTENFFKYSISFRRLLYFLLGSLLLITMFISCEEKPDFIGGDLLPRGDDFIVAFDSMEVIYGYTTPGDSLANRFKQFHLLGNITDPFFGFSGAEVVTTIAPSITSMGFGTNAAADSVIIYLGLEKWTGEGTLPVPLNIYEFTELMRSDTLYYSNMDMYGKFREPPIAASSISRVDSALRIFVTDQEFIDKFLTAHDSILRSSNNLKELMNGLYFLTDDAADGGGIVHLDFDQAYNSLYFYYHNDTASGLSQYFSFENASNGRINMFRHDAVGYPLDEYLNNGSDNDSLIFVQSMAGVNPVIRFPGLTSWIDTMPVAINEARLIFTVADTNYTMQKSEYFPGVIGMYLVQEDGRLAQTYDFLLDNASFGGVYDDDTQTYTYTMKVQLQSIVSEDVDNLEMTLIPGNTIENVTRSVLYGWNDDPGKRLRLEITYTKL